MRCPNCDGMTVVSPAILEELQITLRTFTVDLVELCKKKRIDYKQLPVLTDVYTIISVLEDMET